MKRFVLAGWIVVVTASLSGCAGTGRETKALEVGLGESVAEDTSLAAFFCRENGVPEDKCYPAGEGEGKKECKGGVILIDLAPLNRKVTAESERSEEHCFQKLARPFDDYCVDKRKPGNCAGDCPSAVPDCNDTGLVDRKTAKTTKAGPPKWECEATRGACGCTCRTSLSAVPRPPS